MQLSATVVAAARRSRRVERTVKARLALAADPAARQALDQHPRWHLDIDRSAHPSTAFRQSLLERFRLRHRSREAVEQRAPQRIGAIQSVRDHVDHEVVGYQLAVIHERLRRLAEVGPALAMLAQ